MSLPALFSNDVQSFTPGFAPLAEMLRNWPFDGNGKLSVDVQETNESYKVSANVPGAKKEHIELTLGDGMLSIQVRESKESEKKEGNFLIKERSYEGSSRVISLPYAASSDKVAAELKDGVLYITVPKSDEKKSRKIQVK